MSPTIVINGVITTPVKWPWKKGFHWGYFTLLIVVIYHSIYKDRLTPSPCIVLYLAILRLWPFKGMVSSRDPFTQRLKTWPPQRLRDTNGSLSSYYHYGSMYGLFTVATFAIQKSAHPWIRYKIPFERGPHGKIQWHGYIVTAPPTVPTTKVMAQRWCTAVRSDVSELRNAIITCRRVTEESPRDPSSRDNWGKHFPAPTC